MSNSLAQQLSFIQNIAGVVLGIFLVVVGTVGGILNVLIFTRRTLLRTTCGHYFLVLSIASIGNLVANQLIRLLSYISDLSFPTRIAICKVQVYLGLVTSTIGNFMIILTLIDRLVLSSTNVQTRLWSTIKIARRFIILIILSGFLLPFHILFYYSVVSPDNVCRPANPAFDIYHAIFVSIIAVFGPIFLMSLLSIMLIHRLRDQTVRMRRNNMLPKLRLRDNYITRTLFMQVIFYIILRSPYPINFIYIQITQQVNKSTERLAIESFITFVINTVLVGCYYTCIFFIHTYASPVFRQELRVLCRTYWQRLTRSFSQRNNRVVPNATINVR
jgi:hypothetical protein